LPNLRVFDGQRRGVCGVVRQFVRAVSGERRNLVRRRHFRPSTDNATREDQAKAALPEARAAWLMPQVVKADQVVQLDGHAGLFCRLSYGRASRV
jgi:hypothetical protein